MFLCLALLGHTPVHASVVTTPHVRAQLLSDVTAIEPGRPFQVALHFEIIEGWHTYWQNPGDSGNAPRIRWTLPEGFRAGDIQWPRPERFPVGPLMNYGYHDEAWMLVEITPPAELKPDTRIMLRADADWLVCEEECIPEQGKFSLNLPVVAAGSSRASPHAQQFREARQRVPQALPWPASIDVGRNTIQLHLALRGIAAQQLDDVYFFPDRYGVVEHAAGQTYAVRDGQLSLTLRRGELRAQTLEQLGGVLLLRESLPDGKVTHAFAVHVDGTDAANAMSLPLALVFALAGGLLLNLMPCVFPILSMKALSIVQSAQQSMAHTRANGLAFTAGVLLTFLIVAGALLALRASGEAIGWGFQLQSPVFILLLTWLIFAMGLMLSGVWSFGERWLGVGQQLTTHRGLSGAFFTGVLAVIVATPCTAPFMGAALGYALTLPAIQALGIFSVLGLGMALPWLLISLSPGVARSLPKPGAWMETVKHLLAFPLYATCAWLLWVFAQQTSDYSLLFALLSLVLMALALWLWQQRRSTRSRWRYAHAFVVLLLAGTILITPWSITPVGSPANETDTTAYSADRLQSLREQGVPVFVNFTAAWCITCLVNERTALGTQAVRSAFERRGIAYLKGDWTNRDPAITEILGRYARSGVPLYLLYPANPQQDALVLPNILTPGIVLDHLEKID